MDDVAATLTSETLEQIVQIPVLTPEEIQQLVETLHGQAKGRISLVPAVMRLGDEGAVYLLGAALEDGGITIRLDMPALAVMRSFDTEGSLRIVRNALRDLPFAEIRSGDRPFVVAVRLSDAMHPLRSEWLRVAAQLVASQRQQ